MALAQTAPFTIVRPADGSRVREKVRVLLPKGSVPQSGYVGVFLGGKFIEALKPDLQGKYHVYTLDTKGRGIPDGPLKLEMVLYVDFNEQPRIVDRSSIDVRIANKAVPIPAGGTRLRYRWVPGTELVYTMLQRVAVSTISENQNQLGGRATEFPAEFEKIRLSYSVEQAYGNGDGLLRLQALPIKGRDFADLTVSGETEPKRYRDYEMASIYMRVKSTGHEVFGTITPPYVPLEGTSGEAQRLDLFAAFPLPTLPTKAVREGSSWQSRFQQGKIDLEKLYNVTSVVSTFPARGEVVSTEWEMGRPCVKIKHSIAAGTTSLEGAKLRKSGAAFADNKLSLTEQIWFALDTRQVIKIIRDQTVEIRTQAPGGFGGGPSGGSAGGGSGAAAPAGEGGGPGAAGTRGQRPPGNKRPPGGTRPGGGAGSGISLGGDQGGRSGAPAQNQFVRLSSQQIFILDK